MQKSKPWFVYMLECQDGSIYTGIAVDVLARFAQHCQGKGARYTRSHPPKAIILMIEYPNRSLAAKAEYVFKGLSAQQKKQLTLSSQHPLPLFEQLA